MPIYVQPPNRRPLQNSDNNSYSGSSTTTNSPCFRQRLAIGKILNVAKEILTLVLAAWALIAAYQAIRVSEVGIKVSEDIAAKDSTENRILDLIDSVNMTNKLLASEIDQLKGIQLSMIEQNRDSRFNSRPMLKIDSCQYLFYSQDRIAYGIYWTNSGTRAAENIKYSVVAFITESSPRLILGRWNGSTDKRAPTGAVRTWQCRIRSRPGREIGFSDDTLQLIKYKIKYSWTDPLTKQRFSDSIYYKHEILNGVIYNDLDLTIDEKKEVENMLRRSSEPYP